MKLTAATVKDLTWTPTLVIKCASPFCNNRVVWRGQFCASCDSVQREERERLRVQREAARRPA